jgi:hypothetical protein
MCWCALCRGRGGLEAEMWLVGMKGAAWGPPFLNGTRTKGPSLSANAGAGQCAGCGASREWEWPRKA